MSCRSGSRQPLSRPSFIMTVDADNSRPPAGHSEPPSTSETQPTPPPENASSVPTTPVSSRSELLDRARHFLSSPQVIHQDHESKRRFLTEKGLTDGEIQILLREMVRCVPRPYGLLHTLCFFASPRSSPSFRLVCTPHHLRPAYPAFLRVPLSCFRGSQGAPQPYSSSTTCVGAFLAIHTI